MVIKNFVTRWRDREYFADVVRRAGSTPGNVLGQAKSWSPQKLLRWLHIGAACVHLLACTIVFILVEADTLPLEFRLTKRRVDDIAAFKNQTCLGKKYEPDEFKEWVACASPAVGTRNPLVYHIEDAITPQSGGIGYLIVAFTLITAIFHLICAKQNAEYYARLKTGSQPLRWVEYSITYTIMTVIIFQLNEITGIYETALLIVSSVAQMIMGFAIETLRAESYGVKPPKCSGNPSPNPSALTIILLECVATLIMVVHFLCIWHSFVAAFGPYLDSDAGSMWKVLYEYIIVLNIILYALYCFFPLVHLFVFLAHQKFYKYGEIAYVVLSLTSKMALVLIVTIGSQRANQ